MLGWPNDLGYSPLMLPFALESIDEAALSGLVANAVAERRDLEFKRDLPGGRDEEVKEFLADVTSLANAQGGDLLFGIEDSAGVASEVPGIATADSDADILRLENILRDGVEPRLIGVRTHWVPLVSGTGVIVLRVPPSFAAPHRIRFRNNGRFFNRNSRGKYEMDVHELRSAFNQAEGLPQRFRQQHDEAVAGAKGLDMPFQLIGNPTAVASYMPTGLFRELRELPIDQDNAVLPVRPSNVNWTHTLEGLLVSTTPNDAGLVRSYAHTHRNGRVDLAWTIGGTNQRASGEWKFCWPDTFEQGLLGQARSVQAKFRKLGIDEPWVVLVTIFGIRDYRLQISDHYSSDPAWRDSATLPQLVAEHLNEASLMPLFRSFWRLFGKLRPDGRTIGPV
jgi:hypothetical protein